MNELFNQPILEELFNSRNEELSHKIIKNSKEYKKLINDMEHKIKQLLNYVPGNMYKEIERDIDNFLFDNVYPIAEFWNSRFYKIGFADGLNVKKDIELEMEAILNGKSIK